MEEYSELDVRRIGTLLLSPRAGVPARFDSQYAASSASSDTRVYD